jgi:nucleoid DNA-binding protein
MYCYSDAMDIDLLSKMVKELILDNDVVMLPGLGSFIADVVPSSFSDNGYIINPPYRRLSFRPNRDGDNKLAEFYASSNNIDVNTATHIITDFLNDMKVVLMQKKTIVFPELGRLRATRENNYFFVPEEDLDIYPDGYGLEPVSLKTHEETKEEVDAALADLKFIIAPAEEVHYESGQPTSAEPVDEIAPVSVPEAVAPVSVPEEVAPVAAPTISKHCRPLWRRIVNILLLIIGIAVLLLGLFIVLAHVAPDFIDSILYTPEELRIINN